MSRRVVVTGLGVVSPIGCRVANFWNRLCSGNTGIVALNKTEYASLPSRVAGVVDENQLEFAKNQLSKVSRSALFALDASDQALHDANFFPDKLPDTSNIGVMIGIGMVDLADVYNQWETFSKRGYNKVSPRFIPQILPNHAVGVVALKHKITGLVHCLSTACATGAHAIGDAYRIIKYGELDAVLVGASDANVNPLAIAGFSRMRALSTDFNNNPQFASRPFDSERDGFVLSEGAAVLFLESEDHARRRKAPKIYAEIVGYGYSSDAHHISAPPSDGSGAVRAMRKALTSSGVSPSDIAYINAHATSTPLGDAAEASAICTLFDKDIPFVSSIKGAVGHLLGAAGAIESVATALAISNRLLPRTTGLANEDKNLPPAFRAKLLGHGFNHAVTREKSVRLFALKNSFGFYGANAALCFAEFS